MHPENFCQSTHTHTQARFTHSTRFYHNHADGRMNSGRKGTTQEGLVWRLLQRERGGGGGGRGFTNKWTGCSIEGLIVLWRFSDWALISGEVSFKSFLSYPLSLRGWAAANSVPAATISALGLCLRPGTFLASSPLSPMSLGRAKHTLKHPAELKPLSQHQAVNLAVVSFGTI